MGKRAINMTISEMSILFWLVGVIPIGICFKYLLGFQAQVSVGNPGLAMQFNLMIFLLIFSIIFFMIGTVLPNYMISKYNLNLFVDRISNPDFIGWLRFTRSKSFRPHIVNLGPEGQTKGFANGHKADAINIGDYTVTLPNGNKCIIVSDLLSTNVNLEQAKGWQLIKKHWGVFGYKAWEKCADDGQLFFDKVEGESDGKD